MASIFTKIIKGEIPCYKIAENQQHIAFLDINPVSEGHTLVVPKEEIDYIFDLPDQLLSDTMVFAKKIAHAIDHTLRPVRTGIILDGREVPHAHVHLIPIYKPSQSVALSNKKEVSRERMAELAAIISEGVKL
ncbi:MAG: HIT domain-containing protein [Balneolaceae bacterium]|nr:MAG: HIT domain-containing protein [Balneolaceae bacterium]